MSHQRYQPHDAVKEPHSISLKVLRLSRPSLVAQYPVQPPFSSATEQSRPIPASLAYVGCDLGANPEPFVLSPIVSLPPSFGSAYVGEAFSCTLCANHDVVDISPPSADLAARPPTKLTRDVRIDAEMKTPNSPGAVKLELGPAEAANTPTGPGKDLSVGETLQKIINFDLKEEGNHVLAVTVSYYEASDLGGRTRTFRKLYQFVCKPSLIVRTKPGPLPHAPGRARKWVLEAQLENCSEDAIQLEKVVLETEPGLLYSDCNWDATRSDKPVLHPGEVEQVCFVVEETKPGAVVLTKEGDGKIPLGVLGISWRSEMGHRGFISTGKLGTRYSRGPG